MISTDEAYLVEISDDLPWGSEQSTQSDIFSEKYWETRLHCTADWNTFCRCSFSFSDYYFYIYSHIPKVDFCKLGSLLAHEMEENRARQLTLSIIYCSCASWLCTYICFVISLIGHLVYNRNLGFLNARKIVELFFFNIKTTRKLAKRGGRGG